MAGSGVWPLSQAQDVLILSLVARVALHSTPAQSPRTADLASSGRVSQGFGATLWVWLVTQTAVALPGR